MCFRNQIRVKVDMCFRYQISVKGGMCFRNQISVKVGYASAFDQNPKTCRGKDR